jgi:hypothetical protein
MRHERTLGDPSKVWLGPHQVGFTVRMTMAMEYGARDSCAAGVRCAG